MRLPVESNERTEVLQEEIVSLAEDIIDINDKLDKITEVESWIIDWCLNICDITRHTNERLDGTRRDLKAVNDRVNYFMEDVEDKTITYKIVTTILIIWFIIWNLVLTFYICYGNK